MTQATKQKCRLCGFPKPLEDFHTSSRHENGRDNACKRCINARTRRNRVRGGRSVGPSDYIDAAASRREVAAIQRQEERAAKVVEEACARLRADREQITGCRP